MTVNECEHQGMKECNNQCCYFCFGVNECTKRCERTPKDCGKIVHIHRMSNKNTDKK